MGFLSNLFSGPDTEVTVDELALVCLRSAIQLAEESESSLHSMMQKAGCEWSIDVRYEMEIIVWELFIQRRIATRNFPDHEDELNERILANASDMFSNMIEDAGGKRPSERELVSAIGQRFSEYAPAFELFAVANDPSADPDELDVATIASAENVFAAATDPSIAARNLGKIVISNVSPNDSAPLQLVPVVATQLAGILKHFDAAYQEYQISAQT